MRIGSLLLLLWLLIGAVAAYQRHYFDNNDTISCAKTGTVVVTVIAGPLNYVGVNPKVHDCTLPQPSK